MNFAEALLRLVILGPPGSGKGTIATRIIRDFGLKYLCTGDILRNQIQLKTDHGIEAKTYINKGNLVPDGLVTNLVVNELKTNYTNQSWLLDGFPRTVKQAESLTQYCDITKVINLIVPDDEIINRIKGRQIHLKSGRVYNTEYNPPKKKGFDDITGEPLIQRDDDKPEAVKARLISYRNQTMPVIEYYKKQNLLKEFSGSESNIIYPEVQEWLNTIKN